MDTQGKNVPTIAKATGYTSQYLYDLLKGERRWNEDAINKVCAALDITIEISSATK
ncbi:helix-turn-helix domain-containing protein [Paenibacillus thailandensis]